MLGERRGRGREIYGRANTCAFGNVERIAGEPNDENRYLGIRRERLAAGAVLIAIVVSLCGACVVIVESTAERPADRPLTIAAIE